MHQPTEDFRQGRHPGPTTVQPAPGAVQEDTEMTLQTAGCHRERPYAGIDGMRVNSYIQRDTGVVARRQPTRGLASSSSSTLPKIGQTVAATLRLIEAGIEHHHIRGSAAARRAGASRATFVCVVCGAEHQKAWVRDTQQARRRAGPACRRSSTASAKRQSATTKSAPRH